MLALQAALVPPPRPAFRGTHQLGR